MKIDSASVLLDSSHSSLQRHELQESLRMWIGDRRPDLDGTQRRPAGDVPPQVQVSDAGKTAQSSEVRAIQDGIDAAENDPKLLLIRAMIAMLTGRDVQVFDANELRVETPAAADQGQSRGSPTQAPPQAVDAAGFGVEYDRHESYTETEQTSFQATGVIRTTDGKEISFNITLSMSRNYHEESDISIRAGDARKKLDPLVLNFNGSAAQLTSQRFKFDLNSDGQAEEVNFLSGNSGFLAFDRNGDGKINDGSELFGAKSGNGFLELSALDSDQNGWIDENDAAYNQLSVWRKDGEGKDHLATLKQANVGAISLAHLDTPFDLKTGTNALLGQIRSSGLFLQEDGKAGSVQQIDLTV